MRSVVALSRSILKLLPQTLENSDSDGDLELTNYASWRVARCGKVEEFQATELADELEPAALAS